MVNMNVNVNPSAGGSLGLYKYLDKTQAAPQPGFGEAAKQADEYISNVDDKQQSADMSIKEMLAGKNQDVNSVVSDFAKADMSFRLLVGVRNKIIEAYKQTMNMPL